MLKRNRSSNDGGSSSGGLTPKKSRTKGPGAAAPYHLPPPPPPPPPRSENTYPEADDAVNPMSRSEFVNFWAPLRSEEVIISESVPSLQTSIPNE